MSSRPRALRFLSLGLAFALSLAVLAACADEKAPQTIVNTTIGESSADRTAEVPERTAETTVEEEAKTPEEVEQAGPEEEAEQPEQAEQPEEAEQTGDAGAPDEAAVKELFTSATCAGCHTLSEADAVGQVGPVLDDADLDVAHVEETIRNGAGAMPPFEGNLSDAEIQSLAKFVSESSQG